MVPRLLLALALVLSGPRSAAAQAADSAGRFTIGLRATGVYSTRLIADNIGFSLLPDTSDVIPDRFRRDTVFVGMGIAPDLSLVAGFVVNEETTLQLAAGYTFGHLNVGHADVTRDAGGVSVGHAVVSVQKPVRGFIGRVGAGALWMHGGEISAVEEMRTVNPLLELAVAKRWPMRGLDLDAGLVGQATQMTSEAISARGGQAGFVYRLGVELEVTRRLGR